MVEGRRRLSLIAMFKYKETEKKHQLEPQYLKQQSSTRLSPPLSLCSPLGLLSSSQAPNMNNECVAWCWLQ